MAACVREDGKHYEEKTRIEMIVVYDEEALRARRTLVRGLLSTTEGMHVICRKCLEMNRKTRLVYGGTNQQTSYGPIKVQPYEADSLWKVEKRLKDDMFGKAGYSLAGGPNPDPSTPQPPKTPDGQVPVNWWTMPVQFYREILHSFDAFVVVNSTEADGSFAKAALLSKVPYVGIVHTKCHAENLRKHLIRFVFLELLCLMCQCRAYGVRLCKSCHASPH